MQRVTPERGPQPPELLVFTIKEAAPGIKAVSYHLTSSLQSLEANWDNEGYRALAQDTVNAVEAIDSTARYVTLHQMLAEKLHGAITLPDEPIAFEADDVLGLGNALFRLGNSGLSHAINSLRRGTIGSNDVGRAEATALGTATDAYELFKQLEPVAQAGQLEWFIWDAPPVLASATA